MRSVAITFGDRSGTGTGGTLETTMPSNHNIIRMWMGTWNDHVKHFDSNWKELRTLLLTIERIVEHRSTAVVRLSTVFYFTDNLVTITWC